MASYRPGGVIPTPGVAIIGPELIINGRPCPAPVEVTTIGEAATRWLCGCGRCNLHPPPPCTCGHAGTHRPDPGIGCTVAACLCLEPADPAIAPPAPGRVWLGAY